jgi:phage terminase large subunit
MSYQATTATKKIADLKKKVRAVSGGTSASKTISIILYLIHRAQSDTQATLSSIISESMPHLKRGALRDFENIMKEHHYWKDQNWNVTDKIYTFETGSRIEFFSADQPDKLRGGRRDRAFINEANNVPLEAFDEIEVRTKEFIFLDWNPVSEFWFYTEVLPRRTDVEFITVTYKDNEALSPEIVASIEQRKDRLAWWNVYGLGLLGEAEGRVFTGWATIDSIPHEARLERYGVDFGYSNDPTAIVALYWYNGGYIVDEVCFQKGLSNKQIADILANLPRSLVVADSAEPKSIDEIRMYGITIVPAQKGPGSIQQGIQSVQAQKMSVTKQSVNILKEYRNYMWVKDKKTARIVNEPDDIWNHSMDAIRYAISSLAPVIQRQDFLRSFPRTQVDPKPNPAR